MFKKFIIALFILCLCTPTVYSLISGIDTDNAPKPIKDGKVNNSFSDDTNEYIKSNQALYNASVLSTNFVKSELFKSETSNVITGSDGYYFYSDTKNDILATNTLTQTQIYSTMKTMSLLQEYCETNGCKFVFTIAPNKATIYEDKLPYNFRQSNNPSNYENIKDETAKFDINFADNNNLLKSNGDTYLKEDSHWNNYGALLAFNNIENQLWGSIPKNLNIKNVTFEQLNDDTGDLSNMLYPNVKSPDNQVIPTNIDEIYNSFSIKIKGESTRDTKKLMKKISSISEDYVKIETKSKQNINKNAYVLRDSFCRALLPYIASVYKNAVFQKSVVFDGYINDISEYDCLIFEVSERNISRIAENRQVIPAPIRETPKDLSDKSSSKGATIKISNEYSDFTEVSGIIDASYIKGNAPILVSITSPNGENQTFEAFPGEVNGNDFSYYMTTDVEIPSGSKIDVIINNEIVVNTIYR